MVNTEFGQNPSVSLKNSASFFVSKSWSADNGVTKGMVLFFNSIFEATINKK
ncbi:hypothetical protein GCM10022257_09780 [Hyunsoonleella aestuarii]|uniref:Uncharacterized protein n=1 Tax=Hyunsoonleella aestuarii TaxID=912802 RepID=A0ABP8E9I7_9FLAO